MIWLRPQKKSSKHRGCFSQNSKRPFRTWLGTGIFRCYSSVFQKKMKKTQKDFMCNELGPLRYHLLTRHSYLTQARALLRCFCVTLVNTSDSPTHPRPPRCTPKEQTRSVCRRSALLMPILRNTQKRSSAVHMQNLGKGNVEASDLLSMPRECLQNTVLMFLSTSEKRGSRPGGRF